MAAEGAGGVSLESERRLPRRRIPQGAVWAIRRDSTGCRPQYSEAARIMSVRRRSDDGRGLPRSTSPKPAGGSTGGCPGGTTAWRDAGLPGRRDAGRAARRRSHRLSVLEP